MALTVEMVPLTPSEWAESKRYLPPQVTPMPGFYRFDVAPYMRDPLNDLGLDSPVREVTVMKGVQLAFTVGVLENVIGYLIDFVRTAPVMMVTADAELAKLRMESYITPMLQHSELEHLITSADEKNTRKTGKTDRKIEWSGGGFLVPFGAQNANKLRSLSIQYLLNDEIDGWPDVVGKDGDPLKLVRDRTAAFEGSRKILNGSTPTIKGQSKIEKSFLQGDQRRYFVCCLACGHAQTLKWRRTDPDTGVITGIVWDLDPETGHLDRDSVRYLCEKCSHPHTNDDKTRLLSPDNGAEWRPTITPTSADHRSYHISALYSPPGMQTWAACVLKWIEAWDPENNRPRDLDALQVFYNNVLGEPFEIRGEKLAFETVSAHRRHNYRFGELPNKWAAEFAGGPVLLLTCTVDVHKESLAVAVFGWCRDRRAILIDYWRFEGDTEQLDNAATWGRLSELIESREYKADDGKRYRIAVTLVDSGYRTDQVYEFARRYESGVYAIKGREFPPKGATKREFSVRTTAMGTVAYDITVDFYKDRWSAALKHGWDGHSLQSEGYFNAPADATDAQLKELTVEVKREKIEKITGKRIGFEWHRPSGAANELWDLLVYANAALDILAHNICVAYWDLESVSWSMFYDACEQQKPFFSEPPN
jgi:phage terminase large subunit GpA-like protein